MSIYDDTRKQFANRAAPATGFFSGLSHRLAQYRTYRRTLEELQSLSDRELSDLGISRHSLRSIAYQAAYDG